MLSFTTRQVRLRKPRTVSCISSNVKRLRPKPKFRTGWTTSRSMEPWRTSTLPVKTVQATPDSRADLIKKRTAELIESVRESLQQSPKRSMRKRSQPLGMSRETCRRVLVNDIRAYPYRIQTLQTLTVSDKK